VPILLIMILTWMLSTIFQLIKTKLIELAGSAGGAGRAAGGGGGGADSEYLKRRPRGVLALVQYRKGWINL